MPGAVVQDIAANANKWLVGKGTAQIEKLGYLVFARPCFAFQHHGRVVLVGCKDKRGEGRFALDDAKGALLKIDAHVFGIEPIDAGPHGAAASMAHGKDVKRVPAHILFAGIEREELAVARKQQAPSLGCLVSMVSRVLDQGIAMLLCRCQGGKGNGRVAVEGDDIDAGVGKRSDKKPLQ